MGTKAEGSAVIVAIEHIMKAGNDVEAKAIYRRIPRYLSFAVRGCWFDTGG